MTDTTTVTDTVSLPLLVDLAIGHDADFYANQEWRSRARADTPQEARADPRLPMDEGAIYVLTRIRTPRATSESSLRLETSD
jgi:hypothetical protein